jgi:DNA topoisomerase-1
MKLVIVESPKKCETIGHYLGPDYKVMASQGHIRDLATRGEGGLGIDVEHGFEPDFVINKNKYGIVRELQSAARKADEVILATDPDREGEAISWHLAQVLKLDVNTTKRLQFHEITRPAILSAMENPGHIDMRLVESQETRRMYDRIIGFRISKLLQKRIGSKSAGRVQSVTLRMICDNDAEIKAFKPAEYWTVDVDIEVGGKPLRVSLAEVDGKPVSIKRKEEADAIVARIGQALKATSVTKSEKRIPSKLPFTTSTMQQEAFNRYHFPTNKTQSLAQRLYEGFTVRGEHVGLITYMRTDSTRLSPNFYNNHAVPFIKETYGDRYVGRLKMAHNAASAQDAHEAIRPTGTHRTPEIVDAEIGGDEAKLYRLIYCRALASCMADKIEEVTNASFECDGLLFKVSGARTLFKGYEAVYGDFEDDDTKILPPLEEGVSYKVLKIDPEQKFTKAPARYSEAKVVKLMEEKGIGRPSTYASTIQTLKKRAYVTSKGGILTPTEEGIRTTLVMSKYFPEIVSVSYTANMETELDKIEDGSLTRLEAMNSFYWPFMKHYDEVSEKMYKDPEEETGELCPKCGSPLVVKKGRYGTFVACSNYPKCDYVQRKPKEPLKETGETCPVCGAPLVERKDRRGRPFIGCSRYPKCTYVKGAERKKEPNKTRYTEADWVKPCPECKTGHLVLKHGKRVDFLGCTNFPRCRHVEWLDDKKKK